MTRLLSESMPFEMRPFLSPQELEEAISSKEGMDALLAKMQEHHGANEEHQRSFLSKPMSFVGPAHAILYMVRVSKELWPEARITVRKITVRKNDMGSGFVPGVLKAFVTLKS